MTTRARIIAAFIGLIVLVLVSLLGCVPVKTKAPQIVTVTVSHYIAIPAEITNAACCDDGGGGVCKKRDGQRDDGRWISCVRP